MSKSTETPASALQALMDEYQISPVKLAQLTKLTAVTTRNLSLGKCRITPPIALRLAKLFKPTAEYWLDLQTKTEVAAAAREPELAEVLKTITQAAKPASAKTPPANKTKPAKTNKPLAAQKSKTAGKPQKAAVKTGTVAKKPRPKKPD
jgi:addiction module HigA family antidote